MLCYRNLNPKEEIAIEIGQAPAARRVSYGLKWNPNPPITVASLVTYAIAAGVYTILSWSAVIALPVGVVGVSSLFVAIGFGIPFAIWFGGWGLVIGYIGSFVGAGLLAGTPLLLSIPFALVDWIQFGIPLLAYRLLAANVGLNPLGKDVYTPKGMLFFGAFGCVLPNGLGALYGITILALGGLVPPDAFWPAAAAWWIGNMIVSIIIAPILLSVLTPVIERYGLATSGVMS
jgi:integral membrane sensor domain MASE1